MPLSQAEPARVARRRMGVISYASTVADSASPVRVERRVGERRPARGSSATTPAFHTVAPRCRRTGATLADHAAGNYRVLINLADERITVAADRDLPRLDEKLYLDVFGQPPKPKPPARRR
jgi:hypothetical protein